MKLVPMFAIVAASIAVAGPAAGFQINPLKNKYRGGNGPGGLWEQISQPVHEEITEAAVRCAKARDPAPQSRAAVPCATDTDAAAPEPRGHKYDALIRGVWWNDDPNQHLFGVGYGTWVAWMDDAHRIATTGHNWLGHHTTIGPDYKMQYRSHYGDLQFLHAMASADREAPEETRRKVLDWIAFAYEVATRRLEPDTPLAEVRSKSTAEFFVQQPGWTVNYLFAPKFTLGKSTIPDVALGSILHVLQDSFSDAHVERAYAPARGCPDGRVIQFHAYGSQDPTRHTKSDTRTAWLAGTYTPVTNPVEVSARMITFAHTGADWSSVVEPWLRNTVFCLGEDAQPAGPGEYGRVTA